MMSDSYARRQGAKAPRLCLLCLFHSTPLRPETCRQRAHSLFFSVFRFDAGLLLDASGTLDELAKGSS